MNETVALEPRRERLRVLLTGGHAADAFDNAGGTLTLHARRGDVRFLYYPDDILLVTGELVLRVADIIREVRPHIVITHHPLEDGGVGTPATCGQITLRAIGSAGGLSRDRRLKPHRVEQAFFEGTVMNTRHNASLTAAATTFCDVIMDVTDVVDQKVRALDQVRSQGYSGAYARKRIESVEGRLGTLGRLRVAYGEAFSRRYAETYGALPLADTSVRHMVESSAEQRNRYARLLASAVPVGEPGGGRQRRETGAAPAGHTADAQAGTEAVSRQRRGRKRAR